MRTVLSVSAVASATLIASTLAANCNPSYNVAGSGECYTNCNIVSCVFLNDRVNITNTFII